MPHGITQCYLPPGRGDIPALTLAEAGTRLSDPEGCKAELTYVTTGNQVVKRIRHKAASTQRIVQSYSTGGINVLPFLIMVPCAHTSLPPSNDISIGSAAFAVLAILPADRHADIRTTERATPVTMGLTYARSAASQPNNRH